jgi:hypothetical protein
MVYVFDRIYKTEFNKSILDLLKVRSIDFSFYTNVGITEAEFYHPLRDLTLHKMDKDIDSILFYNIVE